ncbi:MAG: 16S rRNA (cytidine(1402)-2'-O)-methyltransferase [Micrococcus sp.]|nr:16S rRNA (cytidine(1402)-2'-O)-methyltransferase [Micrococcus sp.]
MATTSVSPGQFIVAGTPIGNLGDASARLRAALAGADVVAAEDTRVARKLCQGLGVETSAQFFAHHEHNEAASTQGLLSMVREGATVVLISDAGMPTISDPGSRVVAAAVAEDLPVTCLPGPSAVTTALALSGLPSERFAFDGFVPRKEGERRRLLEGLRTEPRTVVLFESPQRILATLERVAEVLGERRRVCVARELTKLHEEVVRGTASELLEWARERHTGEGIRGEIVLLIGAAPAEASSSSPEDVIDEVEAHVVAGTRLKEAVALVAGAHGLRSREVYDAVTRARSR